MTDVTIDANVGSLNDLKSVRGGPFWTSPTVGYVIYLNATYDLVYRKTSDGGATWSGAQVVVAAASCNAGRYDCYADWQTEGDAGTKIHIAYMTRDLDQIRYVYLDTSGDSVGGDDLIEAAQGNGTIYSTGWATAQISITKTRGGNLAVLYKYQNDDASPFQAFYTSPDGDTWTGRANPFEASADYCMLFPGNEADNQDIWAAYWDIDVDEISLKTFDDSGNSWSEQLISGSVVYTTNALQMDGAVRLSDGHLILSAWSQFDWPLADLLVWDINGAGSIIAKTNILTDSVESYLVAVFIDQADDSIYVIYTRGSSVQSKVIVRYKKSSDGGGTWGSETAMQANTEDDERWISAGAVKAAWGGKFQPVWFNDDLNNLFTNVDNGISIAAALVTIVGPFPTHFVIR